jgi:hypothetical protein
MKDSFVEPVIITLNAFLNVDFAYVHPLTTAAVELDQFMEDEES